MEYDFNDPPEVGHSYTRASGQRYELIEVQPYVRRLDKGASFLLTWHSACLDCRGDFTVTAGMKTNGLNRRCSLHKSPMQVQRAIAGKDIREAKRSEAKAPKPVEEPWRAGLYKLAIVGGILFGRFGHGSDSFTRFQYHPDRPLKVDSPNIENKNRIVAVIDELRGHWLALKAAAEPDATDLLS